jgi:hypothetical protein
MSKKKPKPDSRDEGSRIPPPPEQRQQASASTATKQKKFSDVPGVQQTLFEERGAR